MTERKTTRKPVRSSVRYSQIEPGPEQTINRETDTLIFALGGLGEIGKNMYCIEHDDEIIEAKDTEEATRLAYIRENGNPPAPVLLLEEVK